MAQTVGEYVVKLTFDVDVNKQKQILEHTMSVFRNSLQKQFNMVERMALIHGNSMSTMYNKGLGGLGSFKNAGKKQSFSTSQNAPLDDGFDVKGEKEKINEAQKERNKFYKEQNKETPIRKTFYRSLGKWGVRAVAGAVGLTVAKGLFGLDPKNSLEAIGNSAKGITDLGVVAENTGLDINTVNKYNKTGVGAGLGEGVLPAILLKLKSQGLSSDFLDAMVSNGAGKDATVKQVYAKLLGLDLMDYSRLVASYEAGYYNTEPSTKINKKTQEKARKEQEDFLYGQYEGTLKSAIRFINTVGSQDLKGIAIAYYQVLNKEFFQEAQDLQALLDSKTIKETVKTFWTTMAMTVASYVYSGDFGRDIGRMGKNSKGETVIYSPAGVPITIKDNNNSQVTSDKKGGLKQ